MNPTPIPERKPTSPESFVDILRMHLDMAYKEELEFLEVKYQKTDGTKGSISIATAY